MKKYLFIILLVGVCFGQKIKVKIKESVYVVLDNDSTWKVDDNILIKTKDSNVVIIRPDYSWGYIEENDKPEVQKLKVKIEDSLFVILNNDSTWNIDSNIKIKTNDSKTVIIYPDYLWEYFVMTDEQKFEALKDSVSTKFLSYNNNVIENAYQYNLAFYKIVLHPFVKNNEPSILIMTLYPYLIDKLVWKYFIPFYFLSSSSGNVKQNIRDNMEENPEYLHEILNDYGGYDIKDLRTKYFKKFTYANLFINISAYLLSESLEDFVRIL